MGKKRAEEPEETEGYEFIPPDFDEDAFIHKEMVGFKTTLAVFLVGILAAVVSWGLFLAVDGARVGWLIGLAVFTAFFAALKPLYRALRIDVSHYKRREWIGSAFLLFFTWLAFWLILINPPVSDFAAPDVAAYASPGVTQTGGEVRFDVFYKDNEGVRERQFELVGPDGATLATTDDLRRIDDTHYRYTATGLGAGTYTYTAAGTDARGHVGQANGTVEVRDQALEVFTGDLTTPTGSVVVSMPLEPGQVYAAYLDLEGGDGRVYLEHDEKVGGWTATRNFAGWQAGNNTFTVVVEQPNRFEGQTLVPGGVIRSDRTYEVQVNQPGDYSGSIPDRPNRVRAPAHDVPGPGLPLLLAGVVAVAVVARRRR